MDLQSLRAWLVGRIAELLELSQDQVDPERPLADLGLTSEQAVRVAADLEGLLKRPLGAELLYDHATIEGLARRLSGVDEAPVLPLEVQPASEPIAIVGIGCAFPGAGVGPAAFLKFLRAKGDAVTEVPVDRWDASATYSPDPGAPGKTLSRWGAFLERIDEFDPAAFGVSPSEAAKMDPQQRLLLETSWQALEDAGLSPFGLGGSRTGVFVGVSQNDYARERFDDPLSIDAATAAGNALSIAANRISYVFDLQGPSLAVDTACSSSLAAIHLACQSLRAGESQLALAGGVNVILSPHVSVAFSRAGVMSPEGRCKPFDARADGYVRGEGVGLVVLKRLSDALAAGDQIYAQILGSAMHQDGRSNGLMAPRGEAQETAIRMACRMAGVEPTQLDYVEAHGTGTALGDVVEATALGRTVGRGRSGDGVCRIGSVKSNLGHLESAAGVAGLIKTALQLSEGVVLATRNFERPNPAVDFEALGLAVADRAEPWPLAGQGLAGVSSFGFGGANVHAVLAAPPPRRDTAPGDGPTLFAISAPDEASLAAMASAFADDLEAADPAQRAGLIAAAGRRRGHRARLAVAAAASEDLAPRLRSLAHGARHPAVHVGRGGRPRIGFVFSGQGGLWPEAGRRLFETEPVYRERLLACDAALRPHLGGSILPALFGPESQILQARTEWAQPALFAIQISLTALLAAWGVTPEACMGHSVGEVAAAVAAGRLSLDEGARIVAFRGRAMAPAHGSGGMALVLADAEVVAGLIAPWTHEVSIAAENGPAAFVLSGGTAAMEEILARAENLGLQARPVAVDLAAHGPRMDAAAATLRGELLAQAPAASRQGDAHFYSTTMAALIGPGALDADHWAANLREPVRFRQTLEAMVSDGFDAFVEIGPHPALVRDLGAALEGQGRVTGTLDRRRDEREALYDAAASLFALGAGIAPDQVVKPGPFSSAAPPQIWASRRRTWFEPRRHAAPARQGLSGPVDLAGRPGHRIWTGLLDLADDPQLASLRIGATTCVSPGTCLHLLSKAAEGRNLRDIGLQAPFEFGADGLVHLQITARPEPDGETGLELFLRGDGEQSWRLAASALTARPDVMPRRVDLEAVMARLPSDRAWAPIHTSGATNLEIASPSPLIRGVGLGPGEAMLDLTPAISAARAGLSGELMEVLGQVLALATGPDPSNRLLLPVSAERLWASLGDKTPVRAYARRLETTGPAPSAEAMLLDSDGQVLALLGPVALHDLRDEVERGRRLEHAAKSWVYGVEWCETPPARLRAEEPAMRIVLGQAGDLADDLVAAWRADGARCLQVCPGVAPAASGADVFVARAADSHDLDAPLALAEGHGDLHLVFAWSLASGGHLPHADPASLACVLQALGRRGLLDRTRLTVITRGAWRLGDDAHRPTGQAVFWGAARAAALEFPGLRIRLLDLAPDTLGCDEIGAVRQEIDQPDGEDQVALRDQRRFAARLKRSRLPAVDKAASGEVFLITGGSGALARRTARALLAEGAAAVVLASRSLVEHVEECPGPTGWGRLVHTACDVTDLEALKRAMLRAEAFGRLVGVIHAAGRLDDGAILNLTPERFASALAPKARGLDLLIEALGERTLDVLALYSSSAATLGSPGQANYCAANAYLDALAGGALACARRVVSIAWGPWAGEGMAEGSSHARTLGLGLIDPDLGGMLAARAVRMAAGCLMIAAFDPLEAARAYRLAAPPALLANLQSTTEAPRADPRQAQPRPPLSTPFAPAQGPVEERLVQIWGEVLGFAGLGVDDDLFELGGDSISATQILAWANQVFEVRLSPEAAFAGFTIAQMAALVEAALIARLDALSDEEVERLLAGT